MKKLYEAWVVTALMCRRHLAPQQLATHSQARSSPSGEITGYQSGPRFMELR